MRVIIYTRFSPQRNGSDSESNEVQAAYCEEHAAKGGHEVVAIFREAETSGGGEGADRPKLWEAIDRLGRGDILLVWRRDRLARNVYLSECINRAVEACGAKIEAVTGDIDGDGPEQKMVRQILASIAEYERKITALRTKFAMMHHQRKGKPMGSVPPFGYRIVDGRLEPVDDEQKAVSAILEKYAEGMPSLDIVRFLNRHTLLEKRTKKPWVRRDVDRVIQNH